MKKTTLIIVCIIFTALLGCTAPKKSKPPVKKAETNTKKELSIVQRPETIKEKMKARGEQDQAEPELIVESPKEGETITGSTVKVKVKVNGDLRGLKMGKDEKGAGNHVHVILDNQPYAAHYAWDQGFELRNVTNGEHTLRMFLSRPWHESYKNVKAFKVIRFTVKNGNADETAPTIDEHGKKLADAKSKEKKEGANVKKSVAGPVDFTMPLLTYSRPKGEYKGLNADAVMIDFWLTNAKLTGDGGEYKVRYKIDDEEPQIVEKWEPFWLRGWSEGEHTISLELVNKNGIAVYNGGYNLTKRQIKILK